MDKMKYLWCFRRKIICNNSQLKCHLFGSSLSTQTEYSATANYPPIEEVPIDQIWLQRKHDSVRKVQNLPTVEQKLIELNMPKYYGYWACSLDDHSPRVNAISYLKYITRTHVVQNIPENYYSEHLLKAEESAKLLKEKVENILLIHSQGLNMNDMYNIAGRSVRFKTTKSLILALNFLLMRTLSDSVQHLSPDSIDIDPRIDGFWLVGGYEQTNYITNRAKFPMYQKFDDKIRDIPVRSSVHPALALRTKYCLPPVVPMNHVLSTSAEIPLFNALPRTYGIGSTFKAACIVPGFWPGVEDEHSQIFIHPRYDTRWKFGMDSVALSNEFQSLLASFTQAHSYAFYQGFTPLNEVTYPFVQQTVTTDGQNWRFHLYQMNTCVFYNESITKNERNNILWMSEDLPLYQSIEGDVVHGLNEDVLKKLVLMYMKMGQPQDNPHPYLADYKYLMHHEAPKEYKHYFQKALFDVLCEQKTRLPKPQIAPWERIYKIYFPTRPRDAKKKFFETRHSKILGPCRRRLDDYKLPYIPRVNRRNPKIKHHPRLNSEKLFEHDYRTIKKAKLAPDDKIGFRSFNILPGSAVYRDGKISETRKWTRYKKINIVGDEDEF